MPPHTNTTTTNNKFESQMDPSWLSNQSVIIRCSTKDGEEGGKKKKKENNEDEDDDDPDREHQQHQQLRSIGHKQKQQEKKKKILPQPSRMHYSHVFYNDDDDPDREHQQHQQQQQPQQQQLRSISHKQKQKQQEKKKKTLPKPRRMHYSHVFYDDDQHHSHPHSDNPGVVYNGDEITALGGQHEQMMKPPGGGGGDDAYYQQVMDELVWGRRRKRRQLRQQQQQQGPKATATTGGGGAPTVATGEEEGDTDEEGDDDSDGIAPRQLVRKGMLKRAKFAVNSGNIRNHHQSQRQLQRRTKAECSYHFAELYMILTRKLHTDVDSYVKVNTTFNNADNNGRGEGFHSSNNFSPHTPQDVTYIPARLYPGDDEEGHLRRSDNSVDDKQQQPVVSPEEESEEEDDDDEDEETAGEGREGAGDNGNQNNEYIKYVESMRAKKRRADRREIELGTLRAVKAILLQLSNLHGTLRDAGVLVRSHAGAGSIQEPLAVSAAESEPSAAADLKAGTRNDPHCAHASNGGGDNKSGPADDSLPPFGLSSSFGVPPPAPQTSSFARDLTLTVNNILHQLQLVRDRYHSKVEFGNSKVINKQQDQPQRQQHATLNAITAARRGKSHRIDHHVKAAVVTLPQAPVGFLREGGGRQGSHLAPPIGSTSHLYGATTDVVDSSSSQTKKNLLGGEISTSPPSGSDDYNHTTTLQDEWDDPGRSPPGSEDVHTLNVAAAASEGSSSSSSSSSSKEGSNILTATEKGAASPYHVPIQPSSGQILQNCSSRRHNTSDGLSIKKAYQYMRLWTNPSPLLQQLQKDSADREKDVMRLLMPSADHLYSYNGHHHHHHNNTNHSRNINNSDTTGKRAFPDKNHDHDHHGNGATIENKQRNVKFSSEHVNSQGSPSRAGHEPGAASSNKHDDGGDDGGAGSRGSCFNIVTVNPRTGVSSNKLNYDQRPINERSKSGIEAKGTLQQLLHSQMDARTDLPGWHESRLFHSRYEHSKKVDQLRRRVVGAGEQSGGAPQVASKTPIPRGVGNIT